MKSFRAGYYIREGMSSIFTHGFMSFASVFIIVACLIIMGSFTLLAVNVNKIIGEFEDENVVLAYVNESYSAEDARALTGAVEAVPNVRTARFVTREEAYDSFLSGVENKSRFEDIDASVLRHRFVIYVEDVALMERTQENLLGTEGIASVTANLLVARAFVTLRNIVSGVSVVIVAVLLVISLFIMMNTVKLATFERRDEIAIMKIVGATNAFIRWPFVFEGFILGLFGSLFAFLTQWGLYKLVTDALLSGVGASFIQAIPFSRAALPLCAIFVAIGCGVGIVGSSFAIRKYLKV
ncbi:MAG: permease-like cell division protein FtsX [Oscillospiraceae bacterium]|jgi:cell division transport system permease protein|nr:permease-like cell division protein FtsX [Oscillospiraceae bacterium]